MSGLNYDTVLHFGGVCLWIEIYYDFYPHVDGICPSSAVITCVEVISITAETFNVPRKEIPPNLLEAFDNIALNMVVNDEEITNSLCGHGE